MADMLFTIGHSSQGIEKFLELLSGNSIGVLVDVRSQPASRFAPHFDAAALKNDLTRKGIKYMYMGRELGGKPSDPSMYDKKGYASYNLMAQAPAFLMAIQRLVNGAQTHRIAVMCSEEDPTECHRHLLLARVLAQQGIQVAHIRGDGQLQTESELNQAERASEETPGQFRLICSEATEEKWKSAKPIRSASRNAVPETSSKHSKTAA